MPDLGPDHAFRIVERGRNIDSRRHGDEIFAEFERGIAGMPPERFGKDRKAGKAGQIGDLADGMLFFTKQEHGLVDPVDGDVSEKDASKAALVLEGFFANQGEYEYLADLKIEPVK